MVSVDVKHRVYFAPVGTGWPEEWTIKARAPIVFNYGDAQRPQKPLTA